MVTWITNNLRRVTARSTATAAAAAFTLCTAAGCVTSAGKAYYSEHTNHRVGAGTADNSDIAVAFGLDEAARDATTVASVGND